MTRYVLYLNSSPLYHVRENGLKIVIQLNANRHVSTFSVETSVIGTERRLRRRLGNRKENRRYATLLFNTTGVGKKGDMRVDFFLSLV